MPFGVNLMGAKTHTRLPRCKHATLQHEATCSKYWGGPGGGGGTPAAEGVLKILWFRGIKGGGGGGGGGGPSP